MNDKTIERFIQNIAEIEPKKTFHKGPGYDYWDVERWPDWFEKLVEAARKAAAAIAANPATEPSPSSPCSPV